MSSRIFRDRRGKKAGLFVWFVGERSPVSSGTEEGKRSEPFAERRKEG